MGAVVVRWLAQRGFQFPPSDEKTGRLPRCRFLLHHHPLHREMSGDGSWIAITNGRNHTLPLSPPVSGLRRRTGEAAVRPAWADVPRGRRIEGTLPASGREERTSTDDDLPPIEAVSPSRISFLYFACFPDRLLSLHSFHQYLSILHTPRQYRLCGFRGAQLKHTDTCCAARYTLKRANR